MKIKKNKSKAKVKKKITNLADWGKEFESPLVQAPMAYTWVGESESACEAIAKAEVSARAPRPWTFRTAPAHYSHGRITPWEVIDDWKLDYYCGDAIAYICRHKKKGSPVEDIQKAIDFLTKYRDNLKKENG